VDMMVDGEAHGPSVRTFARRAGCVMSIAISVLLVSVLALVGVLLLWSPGRPTPFLDDNRKPLPGSISEKIRVWNLGEPVCVCPARSFHRDRGVKRRQHPTPQSV
jgi:hypothetical protein